jgi:hypothetical protein
MIEQTDQLKRIHLQYKRTDFRFLYEYAKITQVSTGDREP